MASRGPILIDRMQNGCWMIYANVREFDIQPRIMKMLPCYATTLRGAEELRDTIAERYSYVCACEKE